MLEVAVRFEHGLGDSANMAHLAQLYRRHGINVIIGGEENKQFIWNATGVSGQVHSDAPSHAWLHPAEFWNSSEQDWKANKTAGNIGASPLPKLEGDPAQLWRELCAIELDVMPSVSASSHAEAENFLRGLPEPIVAIHAVGTNGQRDKSMTAQAQLELQLGLVEAGYSVVILDFDSRAVQVGHSRIRGIKPTWGHISLDRLAALFSRCELLIAVDSGPLHYARLTPVPVLGIFFDRGGLLPHRVCIPSPRLTSLVPTKLLDVWKEREAQDVGWRFVDYAGDVPTTGEILNAVGAIASKTALSLTKPERYARVAGRYVYHRIGYDSRPMELREDGTIGEGSGGNEKSWTVRAVANRECLSILGEHGKVCCTLEADSLGSFRGRWNEFERMPIAVHPVTRQSPEVVEASVLREQVSGKYLMYRRVGYDSRLMEFKADGMIGDGAGGREFRWSIMPRNGIPALTVTGTDGAISFVAFREPDGVFRGQWETHEKMFVDLAVATQDQLADHRYERQKTHVRTLTSSVYDEAYYVEHRKAGLDYLGFGGWQRNYGAWIRDAMKWNGVRVLEVGCACGSIMRGMGEAGIVMEGIDLSSHMIALGKEKWPDMAALLHAGDAADLSMFEDGHFDAVHSAQVAEHWVPEQVPKILRELSRVTTAGAVFFCALDTAELFARQGRSLENDDPTHICIRPMSWWNEQLVAAGWENCSAEFASPLLDHPSHFIQTYDWDWFVARKVTK